MMVINTMLLTDALRRQWTTSVTHSALHPRKLIRHLWRATTIAWNIQTAHWWWCSDLPISYWVSSQGHSNWAFWHHNCCQNIVGLPRLPRPIKALSIEPSLSSATSLISCMPSFAFALISQTTVTSPKRCSTGLICACWNASIPVPPTHSRTDPVHHSCKTSRSDATYPKHGEAKTH